MFTNRTFAQHCWFKTCFCITSNCVAITSTRCYCCANQVTWRWYERFYRCCIYGIQLHDITLKVFSKYTSSLYKKPILHQRVIYRKLKLTLAIYCQGCHQCTKKILYKNVLNRRNLYSENSHHGKFCTMPFYFFYY